MLSTVQRITSDLMTIMLSIGNIENVGASIFLTVGALDFFFKQGLKIQSQNE